MSENTNPSLGHWLKTQRENAKISLEEIAAITKVHIHQLKMIEEDRWKELPAPAFVRGFLNCYARYLNLDESEILRRYKTEVGAILPEIEKATPPEGLKAAQSASKARVSVVGNPGFEKSPLAKTLDQPGPNFFNFRNICIMAGVVLAIGLLSWLISVGKSSKVKESVAQELSAPAQNEVAPAPEKEPTKEATETTEAPKETATASTSAPVKPTPAAPATSTPAPTAAPVSKHSFEIKGIEQSWVNVRVDGQAASGFLLKGAASRNFDVQQKVQFVLSNAGAVEFRWDGKWFESPGYRGDVKSITLPDDLASLKEKSAAPKRRAAPSPSTPSTTAPGAASTGSGATGSSPPSTP